MEYYGDQYCIYNCGLSANECSCHRKMMANNDRILAETIQKTKMEIKECFVRPNLDLEARKFVEGGVQCFRNSEI